MQVTASAPKFARKNLKAFQPHVQDAERHLQLRKCSRGFPADGIAYGAAGDGSDLIRVAGGLHALFARFTRFRLVAIFEAFENLDRSPDRTFRATGFACGCDRIAKEFVPHTAGLPPRGEGSW
jgi:hypothetical protein